MFESTPLVRRSPSYSSSSTCRRLLDEAGEVFAANGFEATTVREICRRAGANIAAVNYHFGSKEGLYAAVLMDAYSTAIAQFPPDGGLTRDADPRVRLRALVHSFLSRILLAGRSAWLGQLLSWEMVQPTGALAGLIDQSIRPQFRLLSEIVTDLAPHPLSEERLRLCCLGVVSQCVFYKHAAPVLQRLGDGFRFGPADIDRLTDHITVFSIGAIRSLASPGDQPDSESPTGANSARDESRS